MNAGPGVNKFELPVLSRRFKFESPIQIALREEKAPENKESIPPTAPQRLCPCYRL